LENLVAEIEEAALEVFCRMGSLLLTGKESVRRLIARKLTEKAIAAQLVTSVKPPKSIAFQPAKRVSGIEEIIEGKHRSSQES